MSQNPFVPLQALRGRKFTPTYNVKEKAAEEKPKATSTSVSVVSVAAVEPLTVPKIDSGLKVTPNATTVVDNKPTTTEEVCV